MRDIKKFILGCTLFLVALSASGAAFDDSVYSRLDYGLYWAGADNQFEKAGTETAQGSNYYDPTKPTMIYIHGWQKGTVESRFRETFYSSRSGRPDIDFANLWIAEGYNVGIIYWNQFADENEVKDAEAKIWSVNGNKAIRWKDSNGNFHYGDVDKPVADLIYPQYRLAMSDFRGSEVRFAGHSLGSQVAFRLADLLLDSQRKGEQVTNMLPGRISILDAYYSNGSKSYLSGEWVGKVIRDIADRLIDEGILIDSYRTSATTSTLFVGDENKQLHRKTAFTELSTEFFWFWQQSEKHVAAIWLYLWSKVYPAPAVENSAYAGVSASASESTIKYWMDSDSHLKQVSGKRSKDPADNVFKVVKD